MLRVTHAPTKTQERWTLCGQLAGPWVAELRTCWERCRPVSGNGAAITHTVVDLSQVTFVDEEGEKLLSEMRDEGAEFVAAGVETKHLLKNLRAKGARSLRRCIAPLQAHCGDSTGTTKEPQMTENEGNK